MEATTEKRPIQKEDLFRFKWLAEAKLSPDGKRVAYVISQVLNGGEKHESRADQEALTSGAGEEEHTAIWLLGIESGQSRQLTSGATSDGAPEWSPDGKQIAFTSGRSGKGQIHIIPVDGGEAWQLTHLEQGVGGGAAWSPDGQWIAFTAGPAKPPIDPSKPYRVTRAIYRFDAMGYVDNAIQDLYVIPAKGGEAKCLVQDGCMNATPLWSPDGTQLLVQKSFKPDSHRGFMADLFLVDLQGQQHSLLENWGMLYTVTWAPDGKRIAFIGTPDSKAMVASKPDLWVMDISSGKIEARTASMLCTPGGGIQGDIPAEPQGTLVFDDQNNVYTGVQVGGAVHIYRVALSGPEDYAPVLTGDRSVQPLAFHKSRADKEASINGAGKNGKLLYTVNGLLDTPDLYLADVDGNLTGERRLTHTNTELLSTFDLPTVEHLHFTAVDGVPLEGWFLKPPKGQAPYPTILYIHGGPHSGFGHAFSFDFHMLCGAGYGVLAINQRGSHGYNNEFSTQIIGDWGNLDYKDLMSGVDYAIEQGLADPDRLGCCGLSGGGNLSCWIVGQTDRFKAAVPENPVTNFISAYGNSDLGVWFGRLEMGGDPHEMWETYLRCSPIYYAHNCKTPTLLLQGENDYRCPAEQSEQFYAVLKANGCTVEMVRFPGSPHGGSIAGPIPTRKAQNDALLGWMNKYVLKIE